MKEIKIIAKGGIFSLAGDFSNYIFGYIFLLISSNFLGASALGAYYWASSIANILGEFARLGTGQGISYFVPKLEASKNKLSGRLLSFIIKLVLFNSIIVAFVLFIFAAQVSALLQKPHYVLLLRIFAISIPLGILWPLIYRYLISHFEVKITVLFGDFFRPLFRIIFLIVFIIIGARSFSLILSDIFVGASMIVLGFYILFKLYGKDSFVGNLDIAQKQAFLSYSLPFLPLNLIRSNRMIIVILGFFVGMTKIGIFSISLKLAAISTFLLVGINFIFRPMLSKLFAENNHETLVSVYKSITRWIFIGTLPVAFLLVLYPASFLSLFGKKFETGALVLVIISLGYFFDFATSTTQSIIAMSGRSWMSLMNEIANFVCIIVLSIILIPSFQLIGAAVAVSVGIVLVNILRLIQSYEIIGCSPFSPYLIKPIIAAILAGAISYFFFPIGKIYPLFNLMTLVGMFSLTYAACILLFGINKEDKMLLLAARGRVMRSFP